MIYSLLCHMVRVNPLRLFSSATGNGGTWPLFLIEFRGHQPYMRLNEFIDASAAIFGDDAMAERVRDSLVNVIPDPLSPYHDPICAYVQFPNADELTKVVHRCCLVRSAMDVWGDGNSLEDVHLQALSSKKVDYYFGGKNASENSWRVNFRRYGRMGDSGLDPKEKKIILSKFNTLLRSIDGKVALSEAKKKLMILEDWSTFHQDIVIEKFSKGKGDTDLDSLYKPSRYLFGIKIAEGPPISSSFEVRRRPYIGTTTMDAISSHLAANAAHVREDHFVLDPFCGTGSLLIAASFLGGYVIGSDIDGDCLGLVDRTNILSIERSKNANFRRKNKGQTGEWNQLNESTSSNFKFYGLQQRLVSLVACSIEEWLTKDELKIMEFDAIISDPPFGRRERSLFATNYNSEDDSVTGSVETTFSSNFVGGFHEDSRYAVTNILYVASRILKVGGKLVFWLPTEAHLTTGEVESLLNTYVNSIRVNNLQFQRVQKQVINSGVWRWLCVYRKTT